MQEVKKEKKKRIKIGRLLLVVLTFMFLIYSAVTIVSQSIQISQAKAEREALLQQIQIQEIKNEAIKNVLNYTADEDKAYIEQIARQEFDYIAQGERVFVNISGD